ncbi:MAG TPA: response regulator [Cyclobacteriaceae bacterium]|nr:response regulator [Cyclobacteriaceae bacterium]
MAHNNLNIIIADDDNDDSALLIEALVENGIDRSKIIVTPDGETLLSILPTYSKTPSLVFLDLNMPRKNGMKVLSEVKSNPELRHIPILILTTSNSKSDINTCYELGGNTYFTKPFSYTELMQLVRIIKLYWFETASMFNPSNA